VSYYNPQGTPPALPDRKRAAARRQLEQMVTRSGRRSRWQRRGFAAVAGGAVVLGTAAAAVAFAHYQPVTNKTEARCYTVASTAGSDHYTTIAAAGRPGSRGRVDHALGVCGDLWREGFLSAGAPGIIRPKSASVAHPVPALVVCTMSDGTAAVFPGQAATCTKLGLAEASNP
jgi:hypothetical protein